MGEGLELTGGASDFQLRAGRALALGFYILSPAPEQSRQQNVHPQRSTPAFGTRKRKRPRQRCASHHEHLHVRLNSMPLSSYVATDDLTVLLGLSAAALFLLQSLYKPQPLVHPILLGRQSDVTPVRNAGESAVYRNYSTSAMGRVSTVILVSYTCLQLSPSYR